MKTPYPLTITRDRYAGVYSGGKWIAWNKYANDLPSGYDAGDLECGDFWDSYNRPVGKGDTPNEAVEDLKLKLVEENGI